MMSRSADRLRPYPPSIALHCRRHANQRQADPPQPRKAGKSLTVKLERRIQRIESLHFADWSHRRLIGSQRRSQSVAGKEDEFSVNFSPERQALVKRRGAVGKLQDHCDASTVNSEQPIALGAQTIFQFNLLSNNLPPIAQTR